MSFATASGGRYGGFGSESLGGGGVGGGGGGFDGELLWPFNFRRRSGSSKADRQGQKAEGII